MLRTKPRLKYCGLTVVLSKPSRFDKLSLLTSTGGVFFNNECLQPEFNQMQADIRLMEDNSPWLEGTRCILLCGEEAMHKYCPDTKNNTLNEMRGSPLYVGGIPAIATYPPQECADIKNHEEEFNGGSSETSEQGSAGDDEDEGDVKSFSNTKRLNYAFWTRADVRKCKRLLRQKDKEWNVEEAPTYKIFPSAQEAIEVLTKHKGYFFEFDMETDYEETNMLCFAFTFWRKGVDGGIEWDRRVYSVPTINYDYRPAYSTISLIHRALAIAIRDNTIVAHNGAAFDFFVLAYKYRLPVVKCYDTMLAMHRCFPEVEKSLGHCVSYWTMQRFHKDTDSFAYRTNEHMMQKLKYCAADVFTMTLIHQAIDKYATTIPGLSDSINLVQRSIRPYLTTTIQGIRYSEEKVKEIVKENDRLMMQYNRIIEQLIGPIGMQDVKKCIKGKKAGLFPGSSRQCVEYFHNMLGYPVVYRSKQTNEPGLGKLPMFKLALKQDNPVIRFVLLYRAVQKETGALKFHPWKRDDGTIFPRVKPRLEED